MAGNITLRWHDITHLDPKMKFRSFTLSDQPYIAMCSKHELPYGQSTYCCDECIILRLSQESAVSLYNALHEALVEHNLKD